jgi:hypothetical protein
MAKGRRDIEKERFWRRIITAQRTSGLSIRTFCAREQLSEPSFYAWRQALAKREGQAARFRKQAAVRRSGRIARPAFVSLTTGAALPLAGGVDRTETVLELVHPRGHVLRITPGCDPTTLVMVLSALSAQADMSAIDGEAAQC